MTTKVISFLSALFLFFVFFFSVNESVKFAQNAPNIQETNFKLENTAATVSATNKKEVKTTINCAKYSENTQQEKLAKSFCFLKFYLDNTVVDPDTELAENLKTAENEVLRLDSSSSMKDLLYAKYNLLKAREYLEQMHSKSTYGQKIGPLYNSISLMDRALKKMARSSLSTSTPCSVQYGVLSDFEFLIASYLAPELSPLYSQLETLSEEKKISAQEKYYTEKMLDDVSQNLGALSGGGEFKKTITFTTTLKHPLLTKTVQSKLYSLWQIKNKIADNLKNRRDQNKCAFELAQEQRKTEIVSGACESKQACLTTFQGDGCYSYCCKSRAPEGSQQAAQFVPPSWCEQLTPSDAKSQTLEDKCRNLAFRNANRAQCESLCPNNMLPWCISKSPTSDNGFLNDESKWSPKSWYEKLFGSKDSASADDKTETDNDSERNDGFPFKTAETEDSLATDQMATDQNNTSKAEEFAKDLPDSYDRKTYIEKFKECEERGTLLVSCDSMAKAYAKSQWQKTRQQIKEDAREIADSLSDEYDRDEFRKAYANCISEGTNNVLCESIARNKALIQNNGKDQNILKAFGINNQTSPYSFRAAQDEGIAQTQTSDQTLYCYDSSCYSTQKECESNIPWYRFFSSCQAKPISDVPVDQQGKDFDSGHFAKYIPSSEGDNKVPQNIPSFRAAQDTDLKEGEKLVALKQAEYAIQSGDKEKIKQVQKTLKNLGYYAGEINGTWGQKSKEALRQLQGDLQEQTQTDFDQNNQDPFVPLSEQDNIGKIQDRIPVPNETQIVRDFERWTFDAPNEPSYCYRTTAKNGVIPSYNWYCVPESKVTDDHIGECQKNNRVCFFYSGEDRLPEKRVNFQVCAGNQCFADLKTCEFAMGYESYKCEKYIQTKGKVRVDNIPDSVYDYNPEDFYKGDGSTQCEDGDECDKFGYTAEPAPKPTNTQKVDEEEYKRFGFSYNDKEQLEKFKQDGYIYCGSGWFGKYCYKSQDACEKWVGKGECIDISQGAYYDSAGKFCPQGTQPKRHGRNYRCEQMSDATAGQIKTQPTSAPTPDKTPTPNPTQPNPTQTPPSSKCPPNSTLQGNTCVCDTGYVAFGKACVKQTGGNPANNTKGNTNTQNNSQTQGLIAKYRQALARQKAEFEKAWAQKQAEFKKILEQQKKKYEEQLKKMQEQMQKLTQAQNQQAPPRITPPSFRPPQNPENMQPNPITCSLSLTKQEVEVDDTIAVKWSAEPVFAVKEATLSYYDDTHNKKTEQVSASGIKAITPKIAGNYAAILSAKSISGESCSEMIEFAVQPKEQTEDDTTKQNTNVQYFVHKVEPKIQQTWFAPRIPQGSQRDFARIYIAPNPIYQGEKAIINWQGVGNCKLFAPNFTKPLKGDGEVSYQSTEELVRPGSYTYKLVCGEASDAVVLVVLPKKETRSVSHDNRPLSTPLIETAYPQVTQQNITQNRCPVFTQYLKRRVVSEQVKTMEEFLKKFGYFSGVPDNTFDMQTEEAVKRFQAEHTEAILNPWGHSTPTGYWYKYTRWYANKLMGCLDPTFNPDLN